MTSFKKNNKGFTLIELLIVIFLMVSLGVVSINAYLQADTSYQFVSNYKNAISTLRTARLYAFTNHEVSDLEFDNYGVYINEYCIMLFADSGDTPLQFAPQIDDFLSENCLMTEEIDSDDTNVISASVITTNEVINTMPATTNEADVSAPLSTINMATGLFNYDHILENKTFVFDEKDYYFNIENVTLPLTIFYKLSTGDVQVFDAAGSVENKSLEIEFTAKEDDLTKSILFYKYSGLSEENN